MPAHHRHKIRCRGARQDSTNLINIPYARSYGYNAFGQITSFNGRYYNTTDNSSYSFSNGRAVSGSTYDAEGNTLADADANYTFDAAGRITETVGVPLDENSDSYTTTDSYFDGTGQEAKRVSIYSPDTTPSATLYFIYSSVLYKLISQADATGKKLKTFVPANGVTVAEQDLVTSGGTTSEHLYFIHQDASGASAEQTDASGDLVSSIRAGEYDAMGRNVADASPYVSLNTEIPTDQGSGIDAFGSGDGFRPGRPSYSMDGLPIPESSFRIWLDSGHVGGVFGLLEMTTQMSRRYVGTRYSYEDREGREWDNIDRKTAFAFQRETHGQIDITNDYLPSAESWTISWSIFSPDKFRHRSLTTEEKDKIGKQPAILTADKICNSLITKVLEKLKSTGNNAYNSTDIGEVLTSIWDDKTVTLEAYNFLQVDDTPLADTHVAFGSSRKVSMYFDDWYFGLEEHTFFHQPTDFSRAIVLVHELFHAYGNKGVFTHDQIATALDASVGELGLTGVESAVKTSDFIDPKTGQLKQYEYDMALGRHITQALVEGCRGAYKQ